MSPLLAALFLPLLGFPPAAPPEESLKAIAVAWNAKDFKTMVKYVEGATSSDGAEEIVKLSRGAWPTLEVTNLVAKVEGEKATVTSHVTITLDGQPAQAIDDVTDLVLRGDTWKVLPSTGPQSKPVVFGAISAIVAMPKSTIQQARSAAMHTTAVSNLKQIGTAAMMLAADNDDKFKIDTSRVHNALNPYLKNAGVWKDPITGSSTMYSFNPNMANVAMTKLSAPAETILFYVGRKGEFEYPYRGRTIIAYADGHVKMVTAAEAKNARWKP